jgi:ABC-type Fe3+/spermidine/putrescine transport system ATPase subunit
VNDRTAPALAVSGLVAGYPGVRVIDGLDLEVRPGEVLALLGPSGSGKSTLLAAVAGFLPIAGGEIRIAGRLVAGPGVHVPPERREVGVVFQAYALWPHLTARDHVAYPFRRRGASATEAARRADAILERLGIGGLAGRRPAELSGGEQQRVGLGRALAREAGLDLFDEPTAHLDATLRERLLADLAAARRGSRAAALYATHDTGEALAVADRVALLRDGRVVQHGTPSEVYERPLDAWAARLTGPAAVLAATRVERRNGSLRAHLAGRPVELPANGRAGTADGADAALLIRPDWARLDGDLPGRVAAVAYRGPHTDYELATPAGSLALRMAGPPRAAVGEEVGWTLERAWVLPRE